MTPRPCVHDSLVDSQNPRRHPQRVTVFIAIAYRKTSPATRTHAKKHHHTGGERAPIAPHRYERNSHTGPQTKPEHCDTRSNPSATQTAPTGPSSPPPDSRCSPATIPDSPIPIHTGCGPPGVRTTSVPPGSPCDPAHAPQSHADTAPTRITSDRSCTAHTLRTACPPDLRYNHPTARGAATAAEKHPLNLIRLAPAEGMQTVIPSTHTDRLPRIPLGASTLRTMRHG